MHGQSKSDSFLAKKPTLLCEIDAVSTEIIHSWMKSNECHCVQCIHIYQPMTGQLTVSRSRLYQIGVCHVLLKVLALVKTALLGKLIKVVLSHH